MTATTTASHYYGTVAEGRKTRIVKIEVDKPGTLLRADGRTMKTSFCQTPTDEVFPTMRQANARMLELNKACGAA